MKKQKKTASWGFLNNMLHWAFYLRPYCFLMCLFIEGILYGQANTMVSVPIYPPSSTLGGWTSTLQNNLQTVDLSVGLIQREMFFSEVEYDDSGFPTPNPPNAPIPPTHPWGRQIELTTTDALTNYDLSQYTLKFFSSDLYGVFNYIRFEAPLNMLANLNVVGPEQQILINIENINTIVPNCTYYNSGCYGICLFKGNKLLNSIGFRCGIFTASPGTYNASYSNTLKRIFCESVAEEWIRMRTDGQSSAITSGYTFQLTDGGWTIAAIPGTLGLPNDNLTTCDFYTLRYYFDPENDGIANFALYTTAIGETLLPGKWKPRRRWLDYPQNLPGADWVLPSMAGANSGIQADMKVNPHQWSFYRIGNCDNLSSTTISAPNNWQVLPPEQNQAAIFTGHYGAIKSLEYFNNVHDYSSWNVTNYSIDNFSYKEYILCNPPYVAQDHTETLTVHDGIPIFNKFEYADEDLSYIAHARVEFSRSGGIGVIGHEFGHKLSHPLGMWRLEEGMCDIWGSCIEQYAYGLPKPLYRQASTTNIFRNFKIATCFDAHNYHHVIDYGGVSAGTALDGHGMAESHCKGRVLTHWFYLLSEGMEDVKELAMGDNTPPVPSSNIPKKRFYRYICPIGSDLAAAIFYKALQTPGTLNDSPASAQIEKERDAFEEFREITLNAVDILATEPAQVAIHPLLACPEYVKAQIRNAWGAVNIGEADFQVIVEVSSSGGSSSTYPLAGDIELCAGQNLTLSVDNLVAGISWQLPDGSTVSGNSVSINNAATGDGGQYIAIADYYNCDTEEYCTKQIIINVMISHLDITSDDDEVSACPSDNITFNVSIAGDVALNSITWKDPNGLTLPHNPNGSLTINNVTLPGTYTVQATCTGPNGTSITVQDEVLLFLYTPTDIAVGQILEDEFTPGESFTICQGESISLYAETPGSVTWDTGQSGNTLTVTPSTTTTYTVTSVHPNCPNLTTTATMTVVVNPTPNLTVSGNLQTCYQNTTLLTASGADFYNWSTGSHSANVDLLAGDYTVSGINQYGCITTQPITVTEYPAFEATITATYSNNCNIVLTAIPNGGTPPYSYFWVMGNQTTQLITVSQNGTHALTVIDANGCMASANYSVNFANFAPSPDFVGNYTVGTSTTAFTFYNSSNSTETWDNQILHFVGEIIVPIGKTLYIRNSTIGFFGVQSGIKVERGGKLLVENSTLQGDVCYWRGISVLSNNTPYSYSDPYQSALIDGHGYVSLKGSTIQNAIVGVQNGALYSAVETGGIVDADRLGEQPTIFDNCGIGIYIETSSYKMPHRIRNCLFSHYQTPNVPNPYPLGFAPLGENIGIYAKGGMLTNPLYHNKFIGQMPSTTPIEKKGTGIRLMQTIATVEGGGWSPTNPNFGNLFNGIDAYYFLTVKGSLTVFGNRMVNTHRGITLTGGLMAKIKQNDFWEHKGGTPDLPAYAIMTDKATAFDIMENTISCTETFDQDNNLGIAIRNSDGYACNLKNNEFFGRLSKGSLFLGINSTLDADCNVYYPESQNDWLIDGTLKNQGVCQPLEPLNARRNYFQTVLNDGEVNIKRIDDGTIPFVYTAQDGLEPMAVSGNVNVEETCEIPATDPSNNQCTVGPIVDCADIPCLLVAIANAQDDEKALAYYTELLKKRMAQEDYEAAKQDLATEARDVSYKVLTATYEREANYTAASEKLTQVPLDKPDNIAFHALYTEILAGIEPAAGSGKTMAEQEKQIRGLAKHSDKSVAALAEVVKAIYYNEPTIKDLQIGNKYTQQEPSASVSPFILQPNPANMQTVIMLQSPKIIGTKGLTASISDLYGKPVAQFHLDETQNTLYIGHLSSGIYFVQLLSSKQLLLGTQKLVVTH